MKDSTRRTVVFVCIAVFIGIVAVIWDRAVSGEYSDSQRAFMAFIATPWGRIAAIAAAVFTATMAIGRVVYRWRAKISPLERTWVDEVAHNCAYLFPFTLIWVIWAFKFGEWW